MARSSAKKIQDQPLPVPVQAKPETPDATTGGKPATSNVTRMETVAKMAPDKVLAFYGGVAKSASDVIREIIAAGVVVFLINRHFSQASVKPDYGMVDAVLLGKLIEASGGAKGTSTLKAYITTSRRVFSKMVDPSGSGKEANYGGIVADIRVMTDPKDACAAVLKWLATHTIVTGDGKDTPVVKADHIKAWAETEATPKQAQNATVRLNKGAARVGKSVEALVKDTGAASDETAKQIVSSLPADKVKPADVAHAAIARIGQHVQALEATMLQAFTIMVTTDLAFAEKVLGELQEYLTSRKTAAKEKPVPSAPSSTATPANTAAAKLANEHNAELKARANKAKRKAA